MISLKNYSFCLFVLVLVGNSVVAADWPTYLHDETRSGSTADKLQLPLKATWAYAAPSAPNRAWSGPEGRVVEGKELRDRVKFDDAFQVAVVGNSLYFGSSVDHHVYCVNATTGKTKWSFSTGAPVRLAPTVVDGRVYTGSDDGFAYCLNAADGKLNWKRRLGPADEWIIGRGEMMSRWPVRTGILVDNGVAYFGAGVFPHENVYMGAVDAKTGDYLWRNDNISHKNAGRNDLSPQGYLLATDDKLFIPSGRSRPRSINRKTGVLGSAGTTSLKFTETMIAGTDAIIAGGRLHTFSLGTRLAAVGDESFVATGTYVMRLNRKAFSSANSKRSSLASQIRTLSRSLRGKKDKDEIAKIKKQIADKQDQIKATQDVGIVWKTESKADSALIVCGNLVLAGDVEKVTAFDINDGQEKWSAKVDGEARGLAIANNRLYVSTTSGKIYAFSSDKSELPASPSIAGGKNPYPKDDLTSIYEKAADQILKTSNIKSGFCLIVGSEQGRLAYELAKRSRLKIYGIEPDAAKVQASRKALSTAGIYGHRVTIHQADFSAIPYSNFFANLIVSDTLIVTGKTPGNPETIARHLKPAGGVACLGRPADAPQVPTASSASKWTAGMKLASQSKTTTSGQWTKLVRSTLPGAGNWSHQYAEPGNTANSRDKLVKGGIGVLWYGDPGPDQMVNRHQGAVGPLVVNGRLFVQGTDSLLAYDTYNGQFLWKYDNPDAVRTGVFQNRTPGNLAANGNSLFHMMRDKVLEHDAATGKIKATHRLPKSVDSKTHDWGYVAVHNGILFGTATIREVIERARRRRGNPGSVATDTIFAIDVKTGKHLWHYQGKSISFETIALGPDKVFFIDSTVTSEQRAAILRQDKTELQSLTGEAAKIAEDRMKKKDLRLAVALDARTGDKLWSEAVDVTDCSNIGIGGGKLTMMYSDGVLVLCGANANGHYWRQFVSGEFKRRRLVVLSSEDGYKLWAKDANYRHRPIVVGSRIIAEPWGFDLKTGEQIMRKHPLTGQEVPWSIMRPGHHCGMLTGSDSLLMFRSGYTGFYDLEADAGTRHFAGHRLGCWINAIPTNGLVVIPEASAGCVCMFSIASTIVMEPRKPRRPWSLYSGVGAVTPIKQMSLNFGAPGDRRDSRGKLWLAYPRPVPNPSLETSLDVKFKFDTAFLASGGFFTNDGDRTIASESDLTWVASSGGRGLTRCTIPLIGKDDKPARYSVKLVFASEASDKPKQRVFDIKVQGKKIAQSVDVAAMSKDGFVTRELDNVEVTNSLQVELTPANSKPTPSQLPILSGIDVQRLD